MTVMPSAEQAEELADLFHLMGETTRLKLAFACLAEPVCVGDLVERIGVSQSLVSHHLRLLRAARVLRAERRGRQVFYAAADDHIHRVLSDMIAHVIEPKDGPA